uniref:Phorbol-ester/DAG-type domain-containing protein n=1 Tax=Parastrongyloides trichosuri TaxID=131310 RepID=A0A0N5A4B0_PARTI
MAEWLMQLGVSNKDNQERDNDVESHLTESTTDICSKIDWDEDELKIEDECSSIFSTDYDSWMDLQKELMYTTLKSDTFDKYQLQTFGPLEGLYPIGSTIKGEGHNFVSVKLFNPTWCDKCGDFIWELLLKQAVQCKNCQFTCHAKCSNLITLNCPSINKSALEEDGIEEETVFWSMPASDTITLEGLKNSDLIEFDKSIEGTLKNNILEEIKIDINPIIEKTIIEENVKIKLYFNFKRPINVVEKADETIQLGTGSPAILTGTITSIYVPKNTPKRLSIKANIKASRFILLLLSKLKIADNPKKFALYIKYDDGKMTKIEDEQRPGEIKTKMDEKKINVDFVLQENDTGGIVWESFELPELENFLKILDLQEQSQRQQLIEQQRIYAFYLDMELKSRGVNISDIGKS